MRRIVKTGIVGAAASIAVPILAGTASAAPSNAKNAFPITVACDNGQTYSAVVIGGGSDNSNSGQTYNAAHVLTSNSVLIPTAFGESTYLLYVNGSLVDQETQPAAAKGGGNAGVPANATLVSCTYSFQQSQTDPTTGDVYTFIGAGTVEGFIPASQRNS